MQEGQAAAQAAEGQVFPWLQQLSELQILSMDYLIESEPGKSKEHAGSLNKQTA